MGFGLPGPHVEAERWTLVAYERGTRARRVHHRLILITKAYPFWGSCGRQHGRRSDQADAVIHADRGRRFDDGVDAGARVERTRNVDPVVPERLEDTGVPGKVLLGQARYHATTNIFGPQRRVQRQIKG